jgi:DivIVA domain-containing protein
MSYSPVEIRHVRFERSLFGYRRGQVDTALAEIASSYESVWQERMDLSDRIDDLEREVARHR